jgi:hypothetical protein
VRHTKNSFNFWTNEIDIDSMPRDQRALVANLSRALRRAVSDGTRARGAACVIARAGRAIAIVL